MKRMGNGWIRRAGMAGTSMLLLYWLLAYSWVDPLSGAKFHGPIGVLRCLNRLQQLDARPKAGCAAEGGRMTGVEKSDPLEEHRQRAEDPGLRSAARRLHSLDSAPLETGLGGGDSRCET